MTSPCSSPSPAPLSSPSSPIAEVSSQNSSISQTPCSSRSRKTSCRRICVCCSDGEQPSTSTSQQTQHTAQKVQQAVKRSLSSDSSTETEEPRKKKCKMKHLESSSNSSSSSSSRKRKRELSPSSDNSSSEEKRHCSPKQPSWGRASQYSSSTFSSRKNALNTLFLKQLQKEIRDAQQALEGDDLLVGRIFQESANESPDSRIPIVLFNRLSKEQTRLHWKKLTKALALLEARSRRGPTPLGECHARKSVLWLQHYFRVLHPRPRTRTLISGLSFTRLCAQAIAAQNTSLTQVNSAQPLPDLRGQPCFLSSADFEQALQNSNYLQSEYAVSFCRHRLRHQQDHSNSTYPVVDFDAGASTSSVSSSQSNEKTE